MDRRLVDRLNAASRRVAWMLGAAGALPFVGLAALAVFADQRSAMIGHTALVAYAAVILSFLGGINWGLTIGTQSRAADDPGVEMRLVVSVVPALAAWVGLLLPPIWGFVVIATAFVIILLNDVGLSRRGYAPGWYPALRTPLTVVVVASLAAGVVSHPASFL